MENRLPFRSRLGERNAVVAIPSAGSHLLRVRRSTGTKIEAGQETLVLPVNAMPAARVILAAPEVGQPQGELTTRGGTELQSDRSLVGRLGPADRIEIRWPRAVPARIERAVGNRGRADLVGHQSRR